jgi:hypothetical protein
VRGHFGPDHIACNQAALRGGNVQSAG